MFGVVMNAFFAVMARNNDRFLPQFKNGQTPVESRLILFMISVNLCRHLRKLKREF